MKILRPPSLLALCLALLFFSNGCRTSGTASSSRAASRYVVYVGTYTGGKSKGIYAYDMDATTGALTPKGLVAETVSPSYLALHPNGRFLYAVNEAGNFQGTRGGGVSAFAIDAGTGKLSSLNQQSSRGDGPCHIVLDRAGEHVFVANYGGGSVAALPVQSDGRLGEATAFVQHTGSSVNASRQQAPHAHGIYLETGDRFAYVPDLGLDKVLIYRFDPKAGTLEPNKPESAAVAAGAGPRHFALHPRGRYAYVINEINSTVTAFARDPKSGALSELQMISTLPEGYNGRSSTAELKIHPSGKFLYGSNRGHDSIVVYAVDQGTGRLTYVEHESTQGKTPRNFAIDPSGTFLLAANQGSDSIVVFRINPQAGSLTPTGHTVEAPVPVCLTFLPVKH